MKTKQSFSILVVEDCEVTNMIARETVKITNPENTEFIIATSRREAIKVLSERNDVRVAFLDWHLPDGNSEGLVKFIRETQDSIIEIIATSSNQENRAMTIEEGGTGECEKYEIGLHINKLFS